MTWMKVRGEVRSLNPVGTECLIQFLGFGSEDRHCSKDTRGKEGGGPTSRRPCISLLQKLNSVRQISARTCTGNYFATSMFGSIGRI